MEIPKNIQTYLANFIWNNGESKHIGCIDPDCSIFRSITDDREYVGKEPITHYHRSWDKPRKTVKLRFYTAPAYGAVFDDEVKHVTTCIVNV